MSEAPHSLTAPHKLEYTYKRSTGPVLGRFFGGLRDGRILGVRRPDGRVLVPPKEYDPDTGAALGELVEVAPDDVRIGMRVEAVWRPMEERDGSILDIAYFRPADTAVRRELVAASEATA